MRLLPLRNASLVVALTCALVGCDSEAHDARARDADVQEPPDVAPPDGGEATDTAGDRDAEDGLDRLDDAREVGPPSDVSTTAWPDLRLLTVNAGTTEGLRHDRGDDGYAQATADWVNLHYNNSLSWRPAEDALTAWLAQRRPDIIAFQEIFHDPWCADIPVDPALDSALICNNWEANALLQVQRLTGEAFDTACLDDKPDLCVAVRRAVGRIAGCTGVERCHLSLTGPRLPSGCGRRARALRVALVLEHGTLVVVGLHGTSGVSAEDKACRLAMFQQVFVGDDGLPPMADGDANVVMGDFNTDFDILATADESAAYVRALLDEANPRWSALSPWRRSDPATYGGALRIDHVLTDAFAGTCIVPGVTPGEAPLLDAVYWDHLPILCDAAIPAAD